jgi:peptidoglycan-associated lipoprotein
MTRIHRGIALALVAATSLMACRRSPETVVPTDTTQPPAPTPTCDAACQARLADSTRLANEARARADSIRLANERASAVERIRATLLEPVYFDYDASSIRGDAKTALDAKLPILRANPGIQIRISGHADERGSDQYNDALGQQRAAETKRYLTDNGIDAARISIVSYGEQRPSMSGADENAWSRNRRAEFEMTGGTIAPPQ